MEITVSKKSWILRIARYGGLLDTDMTDLCSVFWRFVWGMIRAPFWTTTIGSVGALFAYILFLDPIITFLVWMNTGVWLNPVIGIAQAVLWMFIFFLGHIFWFEKKEKESPVVRAVSSTVDVARAAYRGWKDKTCVLVKVD